MDRERHVEIAHILIDLSGLGRYFEQLCDVLSLTIKLRHARLHLPLIAFAVDVGGDAGNQHQIDLGKVVRVHCQSIADAARMIESNRQWAMVEIVRLHVAHVDAILTTPSNESGSDKLVSELSYRRTAVRPAARHGVAKIDEHRSLG